MAFVSRPQTRALGGELPTNACHPPGFDRVIDLNAQYGFGNVRADHSGQFQRNIQLMYQREDGSAWAGGVFYKRLIKEMFN